MQNPLKLHRRFLQFGSGYQIRLSQSLFLLIFCLGKIQYAQESRALAKVNNEKNQLEAIINDCLGAYPFTETNRFKLSAYAELKGEFFKGSYIMNLDFGELGSLTFFDNNCLLRNYRNDVFYLNRSQQDSVRAISMNKGIHQMFEHINLLGDGNGPKDIIRFVDARLAKKNIEPFYKIFVRHILITHGKYDPKAQRVEFFSEDIPEIEKPDMNPDVVSMIKKHTTPLKIVLEKDQVKGYYLDVGGEVFIKDEKRDVFFITGEDYKYNNVTAFKLFAQKLFAQSIQFVANSESQRIASITRFESVQDGLIAQASSSTHGVRHIPAANARKAQQKTKAKPKVDPLYSPLSWIPMMLTLLRSNGVNVGEPEIIKFFVEQPYFEKLYAQLNDSERRSVDKFLALMGNHKAEATRSYQNED